MRPSRLQWRLRPPHIDFSSLAHSLARTPHRSGRDPGSESNGELDDVPGVPATRQDSFPALKRGPVDYEGNPAHACQRNATSALPYDRLMVCQLFHVIWSMTSVMTRPMIGSAMGTPTATTAALAITPTETKPIDTRVIAVGHLSLDAHAFVAALLWAATGKRCRTEYRAFHERWNQRLIAS